MQHVKSLSSSKEKWEQLRTIHNAIGRRKLILLMRIFYSYKARADQSIDSIASEVSGMAAIVTGISPSSTTRFTDGIGHDELGRCATICSGEGLAGRRGGIDLHDGDREIQGYRIFNPGTSFEIPPVLRSIA